MSFAAVDSTKEPRKFSWGPQMVHVLTWSAISGDTSGTITSDRLSRVDHIIMDGGLIMTAAPTYSKNVVTLAFSDPAASVFGTLLLIGR